MSSVPRFGRHVTWACFVPDDVDLDHLVKVTFAKFLLCEVVIFPFLISILGKVHFLKIKIIGVMLVNKIK